MSFSSASPLFLGRCQANKPTQKGWELIGDIYLSIICDESSKMFRLIGIIASEEKYVINDYVGTDDPKQMTHLFVSIKTYNGMIYGFNFYQEKDAMNFLNCIKKCSHPDTKEDVNISPPVSEDKSKKDEVLKLIDDFAREIHKAVDDKINELRSQVLTIIS
ncbi:uncharacterized protein MONOS_217 [Monocercomonoides exilis]|uniref:uncharacterized protein n=1 Tax=Monocercomonoides exilis TaxID=2049356 RepID=UPI00355A7753|nr:hypothetical protein MONOS_217 [Monocercomonoides exilis]|eukprot:MONOS_217.1-p1 / transcript=MONOS_217.1 / gene=MONOS_217 / organism=Monocercomonoides_exilis_PA203 / gene_product=unspecified product / transcript_product=unspecified product / location=Mono_scaffold00003:304642-305182(+) / protein_length=161 / sequence_SO=supercontig / SO=protein_coding / is_pseudo=false